MISWGVFDYNRFKKAQLVDLVKGFCQENDLSKMSEKLRSLREGRFLLSHRFPLVLTVSDEYQTAFATYLKEKRLKKKVKFKKLEKEHIAFVTKLMEKPQTRNLSLTAKKNLLAEKFPSLSCSRTTLHKVTHKLLNYTHKRVS